MLAKQPGLQAFPHLKSRQFPGQQVQFMVRES